MNAASMGWVVVMRVAWKAARKVRRATAAARLWVRLSEGIGGEASGRGVAGLN